MTSNSGISSTVIFHIRSLDSALDNFSATWADAVPQTPRISFASAELMFKTLGGRRLELLQVMGGKGELGVRELARLADRDVRAVHADAQLLALAGVIDRSEDGKLSFPYLTIHVDFQLQVA